MRCGIVLISGGWAGFEALSGDAGGGLFEPVVAVDRAEFGEGDGVAGFGVDEGRVAMDLRRSRPATHLYLPVPSRSIGMGHLEGWATMVLRAESRRRA